MWFHLPVCHILKSSSNDTIFSSPNHYLSYEYEYSSVVMYKHIISLHIIKNYTSGALYSRKREIFSQYS